MWNYIFSTVSNVLWLFVFIPQLYIIYKSKNSDGISFLLVFCWLIGDYTSMVSSIYIEGTASSIIIISIFHIIFDVLFITQLLYYRKTASEFIEYEYRTLLNGEEINNVDSVYINEYLFKLTSVEIMIVIFLSIISIFSTVAFRIPFLYEYKDDIFQGIAWFSTLIFVISRIPQIHENLKNTKNLSWVSFTIIIFANLFFVASILVEYDPNTSLKNFLMKNIQWLLGGTCTILFDLIILLQIKSTIQMS